MFENYKRNLLICAIFLLSNQVATGQLLDTHLGLSITSEAFSDGIAIGESGTININLTNEGPIDVTSADNLFVTLGYNITHNLTLYEELITGVTDDPNCTFYYPQASPRPPVNNILYFSGYWINTDIPVGATYTCRIQVTFTQSGILETDWRIINNTPTGPQFFNFPFLFRGQPQPVAIGFVTSGLITLLLIWIVYKNRYFLIRKPN